MQALKYEVPPSSFMLASGKHWWSTFMHVFRYNASIIKISTMLITILSQLKQLVIALLSLDGIVLHRTYYSSLPSTYILGLSNILMYSIPICTSGQREVL